MGNEFDMRLEDLFERGQLSMPQFQKNKKKRPLLRSWILSYLLVLTPMLLLCYALYQSNRTALEDSMSSLQYAKLHRFQIALQAELNDLNLLASQLGAGASPGTLLSRHRSDLMSTDYTDMKQMRGLLVTALKSSSSLSEALIYLGRSGYGITSMRVLPLSHLYSMTENADELWQSWDELNNLLAQSENRLLESDAAGRTLYFQLPLRYNSRVLFNLKADYLLSTYGDAPEGEEYVAIVGGDGTYLAHTGEEFPLDVSCLGEGRLPENNASWLVTALRLDGYDCCVVSATSRTRLKANLLRQTAGFLIAIPFCTLACFLVIVYSLRKHYNPVAEVLNLANERGLSTDSDNHEYVQLNTLLQKALDDRQKLQQREDLTRRRQDDARLYAALSAPEAESAVSARFSREKQRFQNPCWCYVELTLVDCSAPGEDGERDEEVFSVAQNLLTELLRQNFNAAALYAHQRLLFLVGLQDGSEARALLLKSDLQKGLAFLREDYGVEFACRASAVSPLEEDFPALSSRLMDQLSQLHQSPADGPVQVWQALSEDQQQAMRALFSLEHALRNDDLNAFRAGVQTLGKLLVDRSPAPAEQESAENGSDNLISRQVVQLVQSGYYDPNLNVSAIAQRLGRNPDVVSRAFRQTMHMGPLEYIHSVRIRAATDLLRDNPDMTARRVAELCGYVNIDSFNRAFKRITGTTPGRYRTQSEDAPESAPNE